VLNLRNEFPGLELRMAVMNSHISAFLRQAQRDGTPQSFGCTGY